MDDKPDQIIDHIEAQRDQLGRNLSELEDRVRETTDWRTHFEKNPVLVLGAALGGGLILGAVVGGGGRSKTKSIKPWKGKSPASSKSSTGSWASGDSKTADSYGGYTPSTYYSGSDKESSYTESVPDSFSGADSAAAAFSGANLQGSHGESQMSQVTEAFSTIKGALIAFGISKAKEFLSQAVPGIDQHLGQHSSSKDQAAGSHSHNPPDKQSPPSSAGKKESSGGDASQGGFGGPGSGRTETSTGPSDYRAGTQNYQGGSSPAGAGANPSGGSTDYWNKREGSDKSDDFAGIGTGKYPQTTP
ncbi:MAG: hypothetical protein H7039_17980 [Bryobacteraceae bacterium]|nr:hypothetical protein [Bryobacteraceae bacterium]